MALTSFGPNKLVEFNVWADEYQKNCLQWQVDLLLIDRFDTVIGAKTANVYSIVK